VTELTHSALKHVTGTPTADMIATMKQEIALKAMLEGINDSFLVSVGIASIALVLAFFIKRVKQAEDSETMTSGNQVVNKLAES